MISIKLISSFPFHYERKLYFRVESALSELINTLSIPPLPNLLQTRMKEQLSSAGSRMRKPSGAHRPRSAISVSSSSPSTLLKLERFTSSLVKSWMPTLPLSSWMPGRRTGPNMSLTAWPITSVDWNGT